MSPEQVQWYDPAHDCADYGAAHNGTREGCAMCAEYAARLDSLLTERDRVRGSDASPFLRDIGEEGLTAEIEALGALVAIGEGS